MKIAIIFAITLLHPFALSLPKIISLNSRQVPQVVCCNSCTDASNCQVTFSGNISSFDLSLTCRSRVRKRGIARRGAVRVDGLDV
jgi:hypothetical protein